PPNADKLESSPVQDTDESTSDSSPDLKKFDNILPLTERQLVKYLKKAAIEGYYEENIDHMEQTDKVINAAMNSLDKNNIARGDLLNGLNGVTKTLKAIQDAVKEDIVLNKTSLMESLQATALSQDKHLAEWDKLSTSLAWNLGPRMKSIKNSQAEIINKVSSLKQDTSDIKSMMIEIYQAFKEGKAIVTDAQPEVQRKLVPASKEVRPDLDAPILKIISAKAGEKFKKAQHVEHQVLKREHSQKAKRAMELRMKRVEQYMWTMSNRLKPKPNH
ncbi:hypothetical protein Tco_0672845, partial [Tanacetum coccineum]